MKPVTTTRKTKAALNPAAESGGGKGAQLPAQLVIDNAETALANANTEAEALIRRARFVIDAGDLERAIKVCDDVVARFGGDNEPVQRERVAGALLVKGILFKKRGQKDAAFAALSDVTARFGKNCGGALKGVGMMVARALYEKAGLLLDHNNLDGGGLAILDEIDWRFGNGTVEKLFKLDIDEQESTSDESKATVENRGKTAYKRRVKQPPDIGGATLKQAESQLVDAIGKLGFDAAAKVFAKIAPPDERARLESMAARGRELTGREAAPKLSDGDLAAFMAHAASHQWNPESKPKVAPSAFIKKTFKKWLKRGLALTDVSAAQRNLAGAYSTEVSRDPSKRVEGLYVRPHKLPAGRPRQVVVVRRVGHVADLPEEEAAKIRAKGAARTAKWRATKAAPQLAAR